MARVSSKGQVVIPASVRKAAGLKRGDRVLAIAFGNIVVLRKIVDASFEETLRPLWEWVRRMGLSEEDIDALIEEAKTRDSF